MGLNMLVITKGFQELEYKKLAAHCGICPYKYQSGTSVKKRGKSRGYGNSRMRKLLNLAAKTVSNHDPKFKAYFSKKKRE